MPRNHQALLCLALAFAGCSKPEAPPAEPVKAEQVQTPEQRAIAVLQAKVELADIRAQKDKITQLRFMLLTNGHELTPEQELKHAETIKGLEAIEQRLLKTIAENE